MIRAVVVFALAACGPSEPAAEPPAVDAPPAVEAPAEEAAAVAPIAPEALRAHMTAVGAKPRLYNFWATWCGPCVAELPTLTAFAKAHPELEVVLVNVDMTSIRDTKVAPFLQKHGVTGVTSLQLDTPDPAGELPRLLDEWPDTIPVTIFVKPDGTRAKQYNGAVRVEQLQIGLEAASG